MFFDNFTLEEVAVRGGAIRLRRGGAGPPLLLLHGNPQTHAMWHEVAPALAQRYAVVCPDLRGYGGSFKPQATPGHAPYAKSEMAKDMVEVMEHFGQRSFFLAGHDRGARTPRASPSRPTSSIPRALADYDALAIWRAYCSAEVTGGSIPSGHYLAEEAPEAVLERLAGFFT